MSKLSDIFLRIAFGLALLSFPVVAMAQEPEQFRGIFCDTQEQIERVVAKGIELGGAQQGIEAVNAEVKKVSGDQPNACVHTVILGVRGKELDIIDSPEGKLAVVPFFVVAVQTPMGVLPVSKETVWFTLMEPQGQGV